MRYRLERANAYLPRKGTRNCIAFVWLSRLSSAVRSYSISKDVQQRMSIMIKDATCIIFYDGAGIDCRIAMAAPLCDIGFGCNIVNN